MRQKSRGIWRIYINFMSSWAAKAAMAAGKPEPPPPAFVTRARAAAAETAAANARFQPTGQSEATFLAAVDRIFARWSLLRLAVTNGWSDGDGEHYAQVLKEETLAWLQKRRAAAAEPAELEELFFEYFNDYFNAMAEDGSPREVAVLLITVYQQCATNDLSTAQQILSLPVPGLVSDVAAPEPEEFDGDMSDEDDAEGGAGGAGVVGGGGGGFASFGAQPAFAAVASSVIPEEAEMREDPPTLQPAEDGWSTVPRTGRKPRG